MATPLCLFIHDIIYAHVMCVLQKNLFRVAVLAKNCAVLTKKIFARHKKICCGNKKNYVTPKRET